MRSPYAFFVKKRNAIVGLLEETAVTNWMLSKTYPLRRPFIQDLLDLLVSHRARFDDLVIHEHSINERDRFFNGERTLAANFIVAIPKETNYNLGCRLRKKTP
jgi:hypothetical protein